MDKVSKKFDEWAINGKAESMEKGHGKNVLKFLKKISFELFNNRRKKLKKKIQSLFSDDIIKYNQLDRVFDLRAENLTVDIFCKLALLLKKN